MTPPADRLSARRVFDFLESGRDDRENEGFPTVETELDPSSGGGHPRSRASLQQSRTNVHLRLVEGYTHLARASGESCVRQRLSALVRLFLDRVVDPKSGHLRLWFDDGWNPSSDRISFGHDIEASWVLVDAAETIQDPALQADVEAVAIRLAEAVAKDGVDADGGILSEADSSRVVDDDKHWWPQVEAVVGFLNVYELTNRTAWLDAASRTWGFIERTMLDREHGEWFQRVSRDGTPILGDFKVDEHKCPYHNTRGCFEIMARTERLARRAETSRPPGRGR